MTGGKKSMEPIWVVLYHYFGISLIINASTT